jgi:hypothetical protein
MIFIACCVEFTLNFNHVTGVLGGTGLVGAGQLLPMFIGLFSFVRIMYLVFREDFWEPHEKKEMLGLGLKGTTSPTMSPRTPRRQGTFPGAGKKRRQKDFAHRIVTAWLPWLSTFEWWRGDTHSFELLSEGRSTPFTPVSADMEMRRRMVSSVDGVDSKDPDVEVDTEYHGHRD